MRPSERAILMSVVQLLDVLLVVYVYLRFTELVCRVCTQYSSLPGSRRAEWCCFGVDVQCVYYVTRYSCPS